MEQFESYGAALRNALGTYWHMSNIIKSYKTGNMSEESFLKMIKILDVDHIEENKEKLIELSKLPVMESSNIRTTSYNDYDKEIWAIDSNWNTIEEFDTFKEADEWSESNKYFQIIWKYHDDAPVNVYKTYEN